MQPLSDRDPRTVDAYSLLARLGTGSSGTVYLGESVAGRRVAVKILPRPAASQPDARARFAREVEISRRLAGLFTPEVVGADPDAAIPWMATRFIEGRSLYGQVVDDGPLPAVRILEVTTGVAEALAEVHAAGLVHRDLTPSNVVLSRDGAHLIGFAAAAQPGEPSLTPDGRIVGTVEYIAPELVLGGPATAASDVFSLGGVLYFAATGQPPFGSGHPASVIHRITTGDLDLTPITDPALHDLVAACLSADPAARPPADRIVVQTAPTVQAAQAAGLAAPPVPFPADLMAATPVPQDSAASSVYVYTPEPGHGGGETDVSGVDTYRPPPSRLRRTLTRRSVLVGAGSAVVLAGAGGGGYALLRPHPAPKVTRAADKVVSAHHGSVTGVGVTTDGSRAVTVTSSGQLVIWDAVAGTVLSTLYDGVATFTCAAVTVDGRTALVGSEDGTLRWVDLATRAVTRRVPAHQGRVECLAVAPNGQLLVTASSSLGDSAPKLWDARTGETLRTLAGADGKDRDVGAAAFSPDSRTVATCSAYGGEIKLWDAASGKLLYAMVDAKQLTAGIAFSPDGKTVATTREDKTLVTWTVATGKAGDPLVGQAGDVHRALYVPPSGKGLLLLGSQNIDILVLASKAVVNQLSSSHGLLTAVAIAGDGKTVVAGGSDGDARVWTLPDARNTALLRAPTGGAASLAFSASGKGLATGGDDGNLRLWDPGTGEAVGHLSFASQTIPAVAVSSAKPSRIAVSLKSTLALVDPTAAKLDPQFLPVSAGNTLAFSPDGSTLACGGSDFGSVTLVDVATGKPVRQLVGQNGAVTALAFAPDAATLAASSLDPTVRLWNVADGTVRRQLTGHTDHVLDLAYSPDGKTLVTAGKDTTVRVWNPADGSARRTITGHSTPVQAVAVSLDGRTVATGGADGALRVWRLDDGSLVCTLTGHQGAVLALAFHPKTPGRLASAGQDGTVRFWTLPASTQE